MIKTNVKSGQLYYSERTAISRKSPSMPISLLAKMGKINGKTLYHGRGKDYPGEQLVKDIVGNNYVGYDPSDKIITAPEYLHSASFKTVLSIYVLNVLDPGERSKAMGEVWKYLRPDGTAYFAVRGMGDSPGKKGRDNWIKKWDGYLTGRGTFQKFYTKDELIKELSALFKQVKIIYGTDKSATIIAEVSI